jgi:hypothetical protein
MRLAAMQWALPAPTQPSSRFLRAPLLGVRFQKSSVYSTPQIPTKTPVAVPASEAGAIPADSSASQLTSSRIRCCGSMRLASRREIPKNCGSNRSIPSREPIRRVCILPGSLSES